MSDRALFALCLQRAALPANHPNLAELALLTVDCSSGIHLECNMAERASLPKIILNIKLFTDNIIPAESPSAVIDALLGSRVTTCVATKRASTPEIFNLVHKKGKGMGRTRGIFGSS